MSRYRFGEAFWLKLDKQIIKAYNDGLSPKELENKFGINSLSIINRLKKLEVYVGRGKGGWQKKELSKKQVKCVLDTVKTHSCSVTKAMSLCNIHCSQPIFRKFSKLYFPNANLKRRIFIDTDVLYDLYFNKLKSIQFCAKHFNISVGSVQNIFLQHGWKLRPSGKTKLLRSYRKFKKLGKTKDDFIVYNYFVRALTGRIYLDWKHVINPNNKTISQFTYHLDHKYSVSRGFASSLLTWRDICHPANLQVLPWKRNLQKYISCDLTAKKLKTKIIEFELIHGKVDMDKCIGKMYKSNRFVQNMPNDRNGKYMEQRGIVPPRLKD